MMVEINGIILSKSLWDGVVEDMKCVWLSHVIDQPANLGLRGK